MGLRRTGPAFPPLRKVLHNVLAVDANIDQLTFHGTSVPDEFFDRLGNLHSLSAVTLMHCQVSDAALRRLRGVSSLWEIILEDSGVTDATVETLAELRQLRGLQLNGAVTDATMPHIGKLTELIYLGLGHTAIGDEGLAPLKGLSKLTSLDLSHTNVTDAGLEQLHGTTLHVFDLRGTKVAPEGVAKLQATMRGRVIGP